MPSLLSIVVPVFNEVGSLEPLYQEIADALGPWGAFEVVFVDDGSTDGSITVMERRSPSCWPGSTRGTTWCRAGSRAVRTR